MKGDSELLKVLNDVLRKELTGINQYFMHSRMCRNRGYETLDELIYKGLIPNVVRGIS
jgi:bacterioferritin